MGDNDAFRQVGTPDRMDVKKVILIWAVDPMVNLNLLSVSSLLDGDSHFKGSSS